MEEQLQISKNNEAQAHDIDLHELCSSLPKKKGLVGDLYLYQGVWYPKSHIEGVISAQKHFQAHDKDIILATVPKSGTVWLKALVFAISNRQIYDNPSQHPLLTSNPHDLVPFLETNIFANTNYVSILSNNNLRSPRLFATHIPYDSLPKSIRNSNCPIIYLCRNPYDVFISSWHFFPKAAPQNHKPQSLSDALDIFCEGITGYGPIWDHIFGYWKTSNSDKPKKLLFLMYEDLKKDTCYCIKRIAEFIGVPFSAEEERKGVIEEISRLCSFDSLKELEVNKSGKHSIFDNKSMFRKGEVGDWVNHLTPEMKKRLDEIVEEKFGGFGLKFKNYF